MAETEPEAAATEAVVEAEKDDTSAAQDMDVEAEAADDTTEENGGSKRAREEENDEEATKKLKVDKSVEEERLENLEEEKKDVGSGCPVSVGPKNFGSSVEMFDYFHKLLHSWSPNLNLNKYEHIVLLDLLKKGHLEPERKIGTGIRAFQIRFHPQFKSRCFFVIREDGSVDDFSFRKCVDHILPLPENMQVKHEANKDLARGGKGGGGGGKGGGQGRGRGRGGKPRY
ncbi:protein EMBRYO DEFECTIVE 514-like [Lycium ferocissimum]|uniref:protein EMBRYO DEFECTIVE 514-like n=1 Tax=Lycium ferocissimum TaxID=112874 RepID=UPI002815D187|nr:protein EMBRYO DEFECTIVE 514-like [Lycium ferocissimum]